MDKKIKEFKDFVREQLGDFDTFRETPMDEYIKNITDMVVKLFAIPDVKYRFFANDVDGAYLLGVFNVSGIEGLQKEIKRLKELKVNPYQIIDSVKSNAT